MAALEVDSALTNGNGREIVFKSFDCEWGDWLVVFKFSLIMEDMPVCVRVMMAAVVLRDFDVEDWQHCVGSSVSSVYVPSTVSSSRRIWLNRSWCGIMWIFETGTRKSCHVVA